MQKLFAIPFSGYNSSKTDQGVIFNVVDSNMLTRLQIWVAHIPYSDHDLNIRELSQAPSNVRNASKEILDNRHPDGWEVVTRFSWNQKLQSSVLKREEWAPYCLTISWNNDTQKLTINSNIIKIPLDV